jgi:adenosylcobinamide kinase / adenosylcobinamide-phosphate guanylyltransferase
MGHLTYLTGPVRSGKSSRAVALARTWGEHVVFVATWQPSPDTEMQARVARHVAERPPWRTLEAPADLPHALATLITPPSGLVLDCLTLWASARLERPDEAILAEWARVLATLRAAPYPAVIVGNEVGWSLVPEHPVLRRFRDLTGSLGQETARAADAAWLMVAGCPLKLK